MATTLCVVDVGKEWTSTKDGGTCGQGEWKKGRMPSQFALLHTWPEEALLPVNNGVTGQFVGRRLRGPFDPLRRLGLNDGKQDKSPLLAF